MKEEDLILCKVERIDNTTVFVRMPDGKEGTIVTSEIAPGRIRNLRDYVVPNKMIVCKVLRVSENSIELSLRRVSAKERTEIMQRYKQERILKSAFNQILGEDSEKLQKEILKNFNSLLEFSEKMKDNNGLLEKTIPKEFIEKMKKILEKRKKQIEIKTKIKLKCLQKNGLYIIKKILSIKDKELKIIYISAGNYQLTLKSEDYKKANKKMQEIIEKIKEQAKENLCEFEIG